MNIHAILCCLVKSLNCVIYEHILIERVTEKVKRMLTAVNVNRVFTQSLILVLFCFIEAARTLLLNMFFDFLMFLRSLSNLTVKTMLCKQFNILQ